MTITPIPARTERLVELDNEALSKIKPTLLDVAHLTTSESMQPRQKVNADAISRYRTLWKSHGKAPFPPITVARISDDMDGAPLVVVDGHHRLASAKLAGIKKIKARVVDATRAQAEWLAVRLNREHGVPLAKGDHREAFKRYMRAGQNAAEGGRLKSYREITADLGGIRTHQTFARWMAELFPATAAAMAGRELEEGPAAFEQPDNAERDEATLRGYAEGFCRMADMMPKAQRRAVEQAPKNARMTAEEKTERAARLTRSALLGPLADMIAATGRAVGLEGEALMKALREAREDNPDADF